MNKAVRVFSVGLYAEELQCSSFQEYQQWIEAAVAEVRLHYPEEGAALLVLPEYTTLPLRSQFFEEGIFEKVQSYFQELARREKIYILFCSPWIVGDRMVNQAFLIDPQGDIIHTTTKRNLTDLERSEGLQAGTDQATVCQLPFGSVGVAICLDGFDSGYIQELAQLGATIILQPSANPQIWAAPARQGGVWQPLEWARAVTDIVAPTHAPIRYLINPMLQGKLPRGTTFDGQSSIVVASKTLENCPYQGVDESFKAHFHFVGNDISAGKITLGWIDISSV